MKSFITFFTLFCLVHICMAQTSSQPSIERFSIISNDYREEGFRGALMLNNQMVIWIYASNEDRIDLKNDDISTPGKEKFRDVIRFYGNDIKILLMDNSQQGKFLRADTITGRILQMSDFFKMNLLKPEALEYQIIYNNPIENANGNWQSLASLSKDSVGYVLFPFRTKVNDGTGLMATIRLRYRANKKIINEIELVKNELKPHKVLELNYAHGDQSYDRTLLSKDKYYSRADSIFEIQKMSGKPIKDEAITYENSSKLLWFFGRIDKELPDSCLRFSLQENNKAWITREGITGHSLLLDNLKAGNSYTLKVWYALQPENAVTYQLKIAPFWYQRGRYMLLLGFLTAGLIGLFIYLLVKRRERKSALKLQQARHAFASVRSQLNPHFIFNALSSIQALINANHITKANDYLSRFSNLLRTSLQPDYQGMVPLSVEIELLQQYIELEQLRLPFRFQLQTDPSIDTHAIEIPGMLLQPIAENAIKHGLPGADKPELIGELKQQNTDLVIQLKNNGYSVKHNYKNGMGLQLIEEKIEIMNKCYPGTKGTFKLTSVDGITIASITLHQWMK